MAAPDSEMRKIYSELEENSQRIHQLQERRKTLSLFQELRSRVEFEQTGESASNQKELCDIDGELNQLTEKKAELQKRLENIHNSNDEYEEKKEVRPSLSPVIEPVVPSSHTNIFFVEAPPNIPAPKVYLDLENLPACPSRTQCPECRQFVMTETSTSITSVTWLMCLTMAMIGCVAGCCFIPFCMDSFKSTTHKCPLCRTQIHTIKKL